MNRLAKLYDDISKMEQPEEGLAVILCNEQSYAAALYLERLGRRFRPYGFCLGRASDLAFPDFGTDTARDLKIIAPSLEHCAADFIHLVVQYRCATAAEVELGYLALCACEAVDEKSIWLVVGSRHSQPSARKKAGTIANSYGKSLRCLPSPASEKGDIALTREFRTTVLRSLDHGG